MFLICCSTFTQRSRAAAAAASLDLGGCKCLNHGARQQLLWCLERVIVRASTRLPPTSFLFDTSFMPGELSRRAPSVQPEGRISNDLLKPLRGNGTHTNFLARVFTEYRCISGPQRTTSMLCTCDDTFPHLCTLTFCRLGRLREV